MKKLLKIAAIEAGYYLALIAIVIVPVSIVGGGKLLGETIAFVQYRGLSSPLIISIFIVAIGVSIFAFRFNKKPINDFSSTDGVAMIAGMFLVGITGWLMSIIFVLLLLDFYLSVVRFLGNVASGYQNFPK